MAVALVAAGGNAAAAEDWGWVCDVTERTVIAPTENGKAWRREVGDNLARYVIRWVDGREYAVLDAAGSELMHCAYDPDVRIWCGVWPDQFFLEWRTGAFSRVTITPPSGGVDWLAAIVEIGDCASEDLAP
ncbi:MAG: hypothetical protein KIS96_10900 [Bauldia sp.]|nr:hypothetical protein [Bauldia sp.]